MGYLSQYRNYGGLWDIKSEEGRETTAVRENRGEKETEAKGQQETGEG